MKAKEIFEVCHARYRGLREWLTDSTGSVRSIALDTPSSGYQWRPDRARACEYIADFERIGRHVLRRPEWKGRLKLFEICFLRGMEYRRAVSLVGVFIFLVSVYRLLPNTPITVAAETGLPGLALFYGGLVRARNVMSVLMHCFTIACLVSVLWLVCGYALAFGDGGAANAWIGGPSSVHASSSPGTRGLRCSATRAGGAGWCCSPR